jgi:peroxiredoxin Q/BCP
MQIGQIAPKFTAINQDEQPVKLEDFQGRWLVLYFYPKDNTPGCTTEAIEFSQKLAEFQAINTEILGVSPDSPTSHCKFIDKQKLQLNLLSDPEHQLAEEYGVWQLKKFMGKEYMGIVRSTFLIDPTGNIAYFWSKVKVKDHVEAVFAKLSELTRK